MANTNPVFLAHLYPVLLNDRLQATTQAAGDATLLEFDCPLHMHRVSVPLAPNYPGGWQMQGQFPASFSLTPSIVPHTGTDKEGRQTPCMWHGYVRNGEAITI